MDQLSVTLVTCSDVHQTTLPRFLQERLCEMAKAKRDCPTAVYQDLDTFIQVEEVTAEDLMDAVDVGQISLDWMSPELT